MQGKRMSFCTGVARRSAVLCTLVLATASAPASADGPQLSVSPGDPTGVTPLTVTATVSETTPNGAVLEVIANPSAEACPTEPSSDPNQVVIDQGLAGGQQSISSSPFTLEHGSYTLCGWVLGQSPNARSATPLTIKNSDTLSLSLAPTATDGANAPVSVSGIADVQTPVVYLTRKRAANGRCAANPAADPGTPIPGVDPAPVNFGNFTNSLSVALGSGPSGPDAPPPGTYLMCAWLMDATGSKTVPLAPIASVLVTLAAPTGTLAYSLGGQLVRAGSRFSIAMSFATTASDVAMYLDVKTMGAGGHTCAAQHTAESGVVKAIVDRVAGRRTTTSVRLGRPGVYVACAWLEWPHGTIDGPFPGRFVVAGRHQRATLYYGLTSQQIPRSKLRSSYPITFQVIDRQIVNLSYFARYTCTLAGRPVSHPIYTTAFPAFGQSSPTTFTDTFASGADRAVISGRLGRRRATGSLSEAYQSAGYTCRSGTVTFTARRA